MDHDERSALAARLGQDRAIMLLVNALALLDEAEAAARCEDRFVAAHLAALRSAAAVLAARGRPARRRGVARPLSAWAQLPRVAPELAGWATTFAAAAPLRAAVENGRPAAVDHERAERHLRDAEALVTEVSSLIGAGVPAAVARRVPQPVTSPAPAVG